MTKGFYGRQGLPSNGNSQPVTPPLSKLLRRNPPHLLTQNIHLHTSTRISLHHQRPRILPPRSHTSHPVKIHLPHPGLRQHPNPNRRRMLSLVSHNGERTRPRRPLDLPLLPGAQIQIRHPLCTVQNDNPSRLSRAVIKSNRVLSVRRPHLGRLAMMLALQIEDPRRLRPSRSMLLSPGHPAQQ